MPLSFLQLMVVRTGQDFRGELVPNPGSTKKGYVAFKSPIALLLFLLNHSAPGHRDFIASLSAKATGQTHRSGILPWFWVTSTGQVTKDKIAPIIIGPPEELHRDSLDIPLITRVECLQRIICNL